MAWEDIVWVRDGLSMGSDLSYKYYSQTWVTFGSQEHPRSRTGFRTVA